MFGHEGSVKNGLASLYGKRTTIALRKWFGHDPAKWEEFRRRYRAELRHPAQAKILHRLVEQARSKKITLLYGAADQEHNQAVVLKEILEEEAGRRTD